MKILVLSSKYGLPFNRKDKDTAVVVDGETHNVDFRFRHYGNVRDHRKNALTPRARSKVDRCFAWQLYPGYDAYVHTDSTVTWNSPEAVVDFVLSPFAKSSPEMFTQDLPVLAAPLQGILLAGLWVGITSALNGYRAGATRTLPSKEALIPLVAAWIGSSVTMIAAFAAVGLPLEAEVEFVFGSATVVGGWRLLYSNSLPLL